MILHKHTLPQLFFAGEGASDKYPGTVHGAYISGLDAAKRVYDEGSAPPRTPPPTDPPSPQRRLRREE